MLRVPTAGREAAAAATGLGVHAPSGRRTETRSRRRPTRTSEARDDQGACEATLPEGTMPPRAARAKDDPGGEPNDTANGGAGGAPTVRRTG